VRLKPRQMETFKSLAKLWKQSDTELGSRMVDVFASLDPESQALFLGLPMEPTRAAEVARRMAETIAKAAVNDEN
jgi:hypothetical protein